MALSRPSRRQLSSHWYVNRTLSEFLHKIDIALRAVGAQMNDYILNPKSRHDTVVLIDRDAEAQTGAGGVGIKIVYGHQRGSY